MSYGAPIWNILQTRWDRRGCRLELSPISRLTKKPQSTLPWKACIWRDFWRDFKHQHEISQLQTYTKTFRNSYVIWCYMYSYVYSTLISLWPRQDQWLATATRGVHSRSAGRGRAVGEIAGDEGLVGWVSALGFCHWISTPDAPWCWNIYLHLPQKWHTCR